MRFIDKSPHEPCELLEYRKSDDPNRSWDNFLNKEAVRNRLLEDQGHLCCYCMNRIERDTMKVEHYTPQRGDDAAPDQRLAWKNLLGACLGGEKGPRRMRTCDTAKGDKTISIDPQNRGHMSRIRYQAGRLILDDLEHRKDVEETLNLNAAHLVRNRRVALNGLIDGLKKKRGAGVGWPSSFLANELERLSRKPKLAPYLGILEYWLKKKSRR